MPTNPLYDFAPDEPAEQPLPVAFDPNLRRVVIDTTPRKIARNLIGENETEQELPGGDPLVVGSNPTERYQTWPERMIREGLTAPGDVYEKGSLPPGLRREDFTDKPVPDGWTVANSPVDPAIEAAMATAALAGGGGIAGTGEGAGLALGSSPILRPALKYKDKIYKAPAGGEHLDALPKELQAEFNQMAMSGEDISHFNFGFMNHKGQFLNREAALDYGIEHGLVSPDAKKYGVLTSTLMADSSKPGVAIEAMKPAPAFYSAVEHTVNNAKINKASPQEWLSYLKNQPGVKQEELQWLGLDELKGKQISKAELEQHIADHKVELKEVVKGALDDTERLMNAADAAKEHLQEIYSKGEPIQYRGEPLKDGFTHVLAIGGIKPSELPVHLRAAAEDFVAKNEKYKANWDNGETKYQSYQLPGGENYREMLMTLPKEASKDNVRPSATATAKYQNEWDKLVAENQRLRPLVDDYARKLSGPEWDKAQADFVANNRKMDELHNKMVEDTIAENPNKFGPAYHSSHWDEPNVLAHIRMNDRTINGKKSLHVEEIQSDFLQAHRKEQAKIKEAVNQDFDSIADRMVKAGAIKKVCD